MSLAKKWTGREFAFRIGRVSLARVVITVDFRKLFFIRTLLLPKGRAGNNAEYEE